MSTVAPKRKRIAHNRIDLTGRKFSRLSVLGEAAPRNGRRCWECLCDCGTTVAVYGYCLKSGNSKSCGCFARENAARRLTINGLTNSEFRGPYDSAKGRCNNPASASYQHYGGRGIEFRFNTILEFAECLGPRPSRRHSVDRINVDGHYELGNVRWADAKTQTNNARKNVHVSCNGETMTIAQLSDKSGVGYHLLYGRIVTRKMTAEDAVNTPVGDAKRISFVAGQKYNIKLLSEQSGIARSTIRKRLAKGWPLERAISERPRRWS